MKKYAFITGATGDIGTAIALKLHENGYNIGIHTNKKIEKANILAKKINADIYSADFSDENEVERMADEILSNHSEIDVLINCAGMSLYGLFTDFDSVQRNKIFQVNVLSMMNLTRKILPSMIRKQSGKIVNITSMWGETGASCEVDYSATKSAIIGFTKALAKETGLSGVRVNAVSPGVIKTEMMSSFTNEDIEVLKEETPVGRIGLPEDVANAVAFLVSDKADFITGEVLKVNGGFLI